MNGWACTDKPKSELVSSIIIHVKRYICKVITDSQEKLENPAGKMLHFSQLFMKLIENYRISKNLGHP